jgi:hypothetical protein
VRISSDESRLVRLGVVYADSLRLTILTELSMREMSPTEFFHEIGGPSKDSVRKHFKKLFEYGWLRRVRRRTNGRGRPGFVYRTNELAVIDEETWAEIPLSIRDAFTLQLMQQLSERWAMAAEGRPWRSDRIASFRCFRRFSSMSRAGRKVSTFLKVATPHLSKSRPTRKLALLTRKKPSPS